LNASLGDVVFNRKRVYMMEKHILFIEEMPFFETFHSKGKAVIDIEAFEKWIHEIRNTEFLTSEDRRDRKKAFEESERGKSLSLAEAMKEW